MNKQTFQIPEGCKAVTVELVGNQIITTFEPMFKRGDVLITKNTHNPYESILVYGSHDGAFTTPIVGIYFGSVYFGCNGGSVYFGGVCTAKYRHATPEEAQLLWDALAKKGKQWNPETMQVEEIKKERWRAKKGGKYYYISPSLRVGNGYDGQHGIDDIMHEKGNHFKTEEQAQRAANRLQAELDKFWEEELK